VGIEAGEVENYRRKHPSTRVLLRTLAPGAIDRLRELVAKMDDVLYSMLFDTDEPMEGQK